jgi:beta-1,4-mannooligosaccharide/beta-1,4-mannosyl-N-acetylglucosamine phosphorylase
MAKGTRISAEKHQASELFTRSPHNPLLSVQELPFQAAAVLNPGAAQCGDETILLLRVEDVRGSSNIHVARSRDGVTNWRIESEPFLASGGPEYPYESWGCEDPRVTYMAEDNHWYIAYVAYSPMGPTVGLARTSDFRRVERIGRLGSADDKDAALFPRRFNGRWAILHRPEAGGGEHIWISYSNDLVHWGEAQCVLMEGIGPAWDGLRIGAGPPPIETEAGWLLIYHGVKAYGSRLVYRAGAVLLDRDEPQRLLARSPGWLFQAEAPYEQMGLVGNVVFPTGAIVRGEELWMYYGAADMCVCLATAHINDLLGKLVPTP